MAAIYLHALSPTILPKSYTTFSLFVILSCARRPNSIRKKRQIQSDQAFFTMLRSCYTATRRRRPWKWLLRVSNIDFLRFEVFREALVDIQQKPSLPTEAHKNEYLFDSSSSDSLSPPIGPNMLIHHFDHPHHADVVPVLFRRVPRRLRDKLAACPVKGSAVGWGLELKEGPDAVVLFLAGCGAFAVALVVAILYSVLKVDVRSGFAIAAFMLAFLFFVVGNPRSAYEVHDLLVLVSFRARSLGVFGLMWSRR
jgi:hypothetical protein